MNEIKGGITDFVTVLAQNGMPPKFSKKHGQLLETLILNSTIISGTGTTDLLKKLEILHASKIAGNNSVLTETSEILDTLRRGNVIDIILLEEVSKRFNSNK